MNLDWKWYEVQAKTPIDGKLAALKLADAGDNIHYGIGWFDVRTGEWTITARPEHDGDLLVVAWMPLPD